PRFSAQKKKSAFQVLFPQNNDTIPSQNRTGAEPRITAQSENKMYYPRTVPGWEICPKTVPGWEIFFSMPLWYNKSINCSDIEKGPCVTYTQKTSSLQMRGRLTGYAYGISDYGGSPETGGDNGSVRKGGHGGEDPERI
ncbi:MAG: hypothetical protein K5922_01725, partial [Clostridiales bacterium]|nr:hypothetical protein [Clostridiales bacterium]